MTGVFYCDPFGNMHNRMKEALVLLKRQNRAVVRPPLVMLAEVGIARTGAGLTAARIDQDRTAGQKNAQMKEVPE